MRRRARRDRRPCRCASHRGFTAATARRTERGCLADPRQRFARGTARRGERVLRAASRPGFALGAARRAHWGTFGCVEAASAPGCRVVHRARLWTTRPAPLRPRGVLSTTAKHPVVNPCSRRWWWLAAGLTRRAVGADGLIRLPCPRGDCLGRWPLDGPHETRSLRGAGRPRRATGCRAKVVSQERRSVSDPPGLPTRQVIAQLAGVCP